jgi:hypothetical protein
LLGLIGLVGLRRPTTAKVVEPVAAAPMTDPLSGRPITDPLAAEPVTTAGTVTMTRTENPSDY